MELAQTTPPAAACGPPEARETTPRASAAPPRCALRTPTTPSQPPAERPGKSEQLREERGGVRTHGGHRAHAPRPGAPTTCRPAGRKDDRHQPPPTRTSGQRRHVNRTHPAPHGPQCPQPRTDTGPAAQT
ncbi:unnamed protein product [Lota lota]